MDKAPEKIAPDKMKGELSGVHKTAAPLNKRMLLIVGMGVFVGLVGVSSFAKELGIRKPVSKGPANTFTTSRVPDDIKTQLAKKAEEAQKQEPTKAPIKLSTGTSVLNNSSNTTASVKKTEDPFKKAPAKAPEKVKTQLAQTPTYTYSEPQVQPMPVKTPEELAREQWEARRIQELYTAMSAPINGKGLSGFTQTEAMPVGSAGAASYYSAGTTGSSTGTPTMPRMTFSEVNAQSEKLAFAAAQAASNEAALAAKYPTEQLAERMLYAGTIIPATLITGINTDLPGDILARVSENVYDSLTGKTLLIPQGSTLLARYNSSVSFGQKRVQVGWIRMIRPDGVSVDLGNMTGIDARGRAGYGGAVDEHWLQIGAGLALMTGIAIVNGQLQFSAAIADRPGMSEMLTNTAANVEAVGSKYVDRTIDVQPTITVAQGTKVDVFVNRDVILPAAPIKNVDTRYILGK